MNHLSEPCLAKPLPRFTDKQGQCLAFIHAYSLVNGRPPGRADIQNFFRITPPSVHQMLLTLEREELIVRQKGVARSIQGTGQSHRPATVATSQNHSARARVGAFGRRSRFQSRLRRYAPEARAQTTSPTSSRLLRYLSGNLLVHHQRCGDPDGI